MLKYSFKLNNNELGLTPIEWRERFISQDGSFVSGVCDTKYHLEKYSKIYAEYSEDRYHEPFVIDARIVNRNGYIVIKNKKYNIISSSINRYDFGGLPSNGTSDYHYIDVNGMFVIENEGTFTLPSFMYEFSVGDIREKDLTLTPTNGYVVADTIVWIEENYVEIDGKKYLCEEGIVSDGSVGLLYDTSNDMYVPYSGACECDDIKFVFFGASDGDGDVCKFKVSKSEAPKLNVENAVPCDLENYVAYGDNLFKIHKEYNDSGWTFVCDGESGTTYDVYLNVGGENGIIANNENVSTYSNTYTEELNHLFGYVVIEDKKVDVKTQVVDKTFGSYLGIRLINDNQYVTIGDKIQAKVDTKGKSILQVNDMGAYDGISGDSFVIYNSQKICVEESLCDMVSISESVYKVDYPNGKKDGEDALVNIDGEMVPMLIQGSCKKLKRYGKVLVGDNSDSSTTVDAVYDILQYDGVRLPNGKKLPIYSAYTSGLSASTSDNPSPVMYAELDENQIYLFEVSDIIGSSMLLCSPYFDYSEFTSSFAYEYGKGVVTFVSSNAANVEFSKFNEAFYWEGITPDACVTFDSDDEFRTIYDRLLYKGLNLFANEGYATFRIPFSFKGGENPLQDDLIEKDFFEAEREKAINPIVDMEKDVYCPKYLKDEHYIGASSTFLPIYDIEFNLHFRTRNLDSWKIIEEYDFESGNTREAASALCNWFVNDYYPYRDVEDKSELNELSDLLGVMYFTNNDVFYQKSNISKSFLRLSYYDSTNPMTQSLLATSCIFMDGHSAYKTYIDNSRKGSKRYRRVGEESDGITLKKIDVSAERFDEERMLFDDTSRISSRMVVTNKFESKNSSEGFYMYIFREYSEKLIPKPIYMKIEFNHAGIGKTLPFTVPMTWVESGSEEINGKTYKAHTPSERLSVGSETMNNGVPMSCVNSQLYVPLYAVYDYMSKEYCYVFDNRYVTIEDGVAKLNIFELKIMNEDKVEGDLDVIDTYEIDINEQFIGSI